MNDYTEVRVFWVLLGGVLKQRGCLAQEAEL